VTAIGTVDIPDVALGLNCGVVKHFAHTCPLPRIFRSIAEENVFSRDIQTAVPFVGRYRFSDNFLSEDG